MEESSNSKKPLFNENEAVYDADKTTQRLSASSTVEQYDYKLSDSEYAAIKSSYDQWPIYFPEINLAIQKCLKKLDFEKDNAKINPDLMNNCMTKIHQTYGMFYS